MALCTKSHILVLLNLDTLPLNRQQQDPRPENHLKKTKIKRYERREKEYKETRLDDQYSSFSRATRAQKQD